MTTKKIWLSSLAFSFTLLVFILLTPSLVAQGSTDSARDNDRYLQIIQYVYTFVQNNYVDPIEPQVLYEGALKGMLDAIGDPYTSYIDSDSLIGTSLKDTTTGAFGGVGLSITKPVVSTPEAPAWVEVASPIEDSPGWKAGIQPGDFIISIEGVSTVDIDMQQVLDKLRGPVGTKVEVVIRRGKNLEFPVTLTRALIEVPTVKYAMLNDSIGYLRIIEFTPLTAERVQDALNAFKKESYTSLIIDLRNNPGGLITSVIDVANKFIKEGVIVSTKSRIAYENRSFKASSLKKTAPDGLPIVVLINKGSASASEILAGALKDYHLAYLVGETSYGKGSVQQVKDLLNNDAMKITMARYYTPSDANIDKVGIAPDREVLFPELSEQEALSLSELLKTSIISDYVADKQSLEALKVESFVAELQQKWNIDKRFLKRLIIQEFYRTRTSPLYDLDYDLQLIEAVKILQKENYQDLMLFTKTVRELQKEGLASQEDNLDSAVQAKPAL